MRSINQEVTQRAVGLNLNLHFSNARQPFDLHPAVWHRSYHPGRGVAPCHTLLRLIDCCNQCRGDRYRHRRERMGPIGIPILRERSQFSKTFHRRNNRVHDALLPTCRIAGGRLVLGVSWCRLDDHVRRACRDDRTCSSDDAYTSDIFQFHMRFSAHKLSSPRAGVIAFISSGCFRTYAIMKELN